jgi:tRNA-dihydrouridine synthase B
MAELSHRALRELIENFKPPGGRTEKTGADEYFTEMISASAFVSRGPFEAWYADGDPCPEKLVYQIVGADETQLVRAVALLDRYECLGIDINMGCSAPAITRTGAGVRWMADINRAGALIRQIRPKTRRRLSVKLRTGLEDDFDYLVKFCRRLEEEGVELITLHPRTAREKFKRRARWDYIPALRKELRIPLAGNGDIASAEEILRRAEDCDAVMIGRLAVRQPWVFAEVSKINFMTQLRTEGRRGGAEEVAQFDDYEQSLASLRPLPSVLRREEFENKSTQKSTLSRFRIDIEEIGLRFLELLSLYQPPEFHLSRARRFFGYFCDNLKWGTHVKNLLNRETDLAGIERAWRGYFAEVRE